MLVFSGERVSFKVSLRKSVSAIFSLMASALGPTSPTTQSSAYLT